MPQTATALQQGNAALRAGHHAQAIRHYALGLLDEAQHRSGPIAAQLAHNLLLAHQHYRRQHPVTGTGAGRRPWRVAVTCWSLSENPLGRAHVLASLYQALAEKPASGIASVAVIGSFFARRGRALWPPLRDHFHQGADPAPGPGAIPLHSILVEDDRHFMAQAIDLVSAHPFDLVHLCKPRMPNILLGLLYRLLWDARVLVDIDDDERAFVGGQPLLRAGASAGAGDGVGSPAEHALAHWLQRYHGLPPWDDLSGRPWTELGMSLATAFDGLSVVNRALQQRHGGAIIRHARDPRPFQPAAAPRAGARAHARARARARWHIRPAQQMVIFLGTPRGHKGLLATAQALASLRQPELLYLIVGRFPPGTEALKQALEAVHASGALAIRMLDDQPFSAIPELLAAADLAVLLQDPDSAAARVQTPAKLSDALAMGLTVLAEPTPGLADLAEQGAFIPVDRAQLPAQLAAALQGLRQTEAPTDQAHPVFTRELSLAVNRERLQALVDATARRAAAPAPLDPALARLAALPALGPLPRA
ncbi:glycosyltransferase, partial [Rhabdochromatium marinum]|uniref:glycosyltransferase n=1 Tax=Rhabdochromatium marinum TaxID=48729 RepID=UPI00190717A2|nr:hypothetical protein [Rhabdochromatium marinum]